MKKKCLLKFQLILVCLFGNCLADPYSSIEKPNPSTVSTVIVTCASGELGSAIARLLAGKYHLILTGRNAVKLYSLQSELQSQHALNYEVCCLDYLDHSSMADLKKKLEDKHSVISGLVLITPRPQFSKDLLQDESEWLSMFQATFTGPIEVLKSVLPHLVNKGKIVIIAGTTSVQLMPEYGPACIIRRMWTTYSKALAHQLGPKGISVNTLSPGVVLTDFHEERIAKQSQSNSLSYEEQMAKDTAHIPLRRHAQPFEIAQSIKFLLSEESDFITGINLIIDGGSTLSY